MKQGELLADAEDEKNAAIGRATEQWIKDHPGQTPDYFKDIVAIVNSEASHG